MFLCHLARQVQISLATTMLRVTLIRKEDRTALKVEGSLTGPWVGELRECWRKLVQEGALVEVDLGALNYADANGVALLRAIEEQGSRLLGSSAFVDSLLHATGGLPAAQAGQISRKEN